MGPADVDVVPEVEVFATTPPVGSRRKERRRRRKKKEKNLGESLRCGLTS